MASHKMLVSFIGTVITLSNLAGAGMRSLACMARVDRSSDCLDL